MDNDPYAPRYGAGDRFRDGFGAEFEVRRVIRAKAGDGVSTRWAVSVGWSCYELGDKEGRNRMVLTTTALHEEIDDGSSRWAYLGPAD